MMTAGEIRELRRSRRMTQREFALFIGVAKITVALWETGKLKPSAAKCEMLEDLKNGRKE